MTDVKVKREMFNMDRVITDFMQSIIFMFSVMSAYMFFTCYIPFLKIDFFCAMIPVALVALLVFVRNMDLSKIPMICAHLLVSIAFFLFETTILGYSAAAIMVYDVLITAILTIYSIMQRLASLTPNKVKRFKETFLILIAVQGLSAFFLYIAGQDIMVSQTLMCIIISISMFVIARQLTVLENKYTHTVASSSQRAKEVEKQNLTTVVILSLVLVVGLIFLVIFPFETVSSAIMFALRRVLRFIFGKLFKYDTTPDDIEMQEKMYDFGDEEEDNGPTPIINAIFFIVIGLIVIAAIVLIVKLIRSSFARYEKSEKKIIGDGVVTDIIEKVNKKKEDKVKHQDFGTGYEYKVRKKYYSKVSKAMKKGLPVGNASSPNEIRTVLSGAGDAEIESLTNEYEKVRYGKNQ